MAEVVGPLGRALTVTGKDAEARFVGGDVDLLSANALILLRRCAVLEEPQRATSGRGGPDRGDDRARLSETAALAWATRTNLGQGGEEAHALVTAVRRRRMAAVASLRGAGMTVQMFKLVPDPAVLTGTGEAGAQDVGLALHGTFGWPVLPGSTLKGVAHAYSRDTRQPALSLAQRTKLFGGPRPEARSSTDDDAEGSRGEVTFLDALPFGLVPVTQHVLTPHVTEYYEEPAPGMPRKPPAEYYNPVPVPFLAVEGERSVKGERQECCFLVALVGPAEAVKEARRLLVEAVAEIGLGAKTAAGYGYLREGLGAG